MTAGIFIFILFFLPLLVVPFGLSWFEFPKVVAGQVLIEILFVICFLNKKCKIRYIHFPFLLIFFLTLIHLVFMRTETTFWGNTFRFQGVFLLWHLLLLALLSSGFKLPKLNFTIYFLPAFILLISSYLGKTESGRVYGTLGEPNAFAASAVFLLPFLFFSTQKKILKTVSFVLVLWLILMSGSRAGLTAFGLQTIFLIFCRLFSLKKAVLACLVILSLTLILPFTENAGRYENRAEVWKTAIVAGSFKPVSGAGFGNIEQALLSTSRVLNNNLQYQYVDSSHNFLLDFWVAGGIVGFSLISFLLFRSFQNLILEGKKLELIALLGVVTVMLFNPASIATLVAFWWLVGQGFGESTRITT